MYHVSSSESKRIEEGDRALRPKTGFFPVSRYIIVVSWNPCHFYCFSREEDHNGRLYQSLWKSTTYLGFSLLKFYLRHRHNQPDERVVRLRDPHTSLPGTDMTPAVCSLLQQFRAPAWCDRVLFWTSAKVFHTSDEKGLGAGEVVQLGYRRSETPSTSDHKPVSAWFRFGCKKVLIVFK